MDLEIVEDPENIKYLDSLVKQGLELFPIRRVLLNNRFDGRSDFPLRVLFEMTSMCNARCRMCPQMDLKRKAVHMEKEKFKDIIDELEAYGLNGLWLYHFGESLVHPHFREIIEYVNTKKNLGYIWLSTNGIRADEPTLDFLLKSSLSFLNFSLQSISVENYKVIAPTSPAETIFSNLNSLISKKKSRLGQKPYFRLQIIEQEHTLGEIDTYLSKYYDTCDLISVNMLEHTDLAFNRDSKKLRDRDERAQCSRLSRSDCFINSDGSVAICDNAYNNQLDVGNVWDNSVYEIWNGSERRKILEMNKGGSLWHVPVCAECTDYDL
ncbi:MAG: radical SAM protein [Nitrospirae bacterium]|nr:radical SAM protein [Nitrospirota bacterium]